MPRPSNLVIPTNISSNFDIYFISRSISVLYTCCARNNEGAKDVIHAQSFLEFSSPSQLLRGCKHVGMYRSTHIARQTQAVKPKIILFLQHSLALRLGKLTDPRNTCFPSLYLVPSHDLDLSSKNRNSTSLFTIFRGATLLLGCLQTCPSLAELPCLSTSTSFHRSSRLCSLARQLRPPRASAYLSGGA